MELNPKFIREVDDEMTFCGAFDECRDDITKHWNSQDTIKQYTKTYDNIIIPNIPGHDDKNIRQLTKEDYEETIDNIIKNRRDSSEGLMPYSDTTIQHFRHLIKVVVDAASKIGLCDNVLWGSAFSLSEDQAGKSQANARLKKSLGVTEEKRLVRIIMLDTTQEGDKMGLLLMFACGLRNAEACAVDYGDIREMPDGNGKAIWIYKTTKLKSNELKSGGKTKNADRIVPIPDKVENFIKERKQYLLEKYSDVKIVDALPIACKGNNYEERCSSNDLSIAGRNILRSIKMNEKELAYIDVQLADDTTDDLQEKEPTAYLLRRNFATHMHILGLEESEIEYVLGHDIKDPYETRNEFINEDKLCTIRNKMRNRPLVNNIKINEAISLEECKNNRTSFDVPNQVALKSNLDDGKIIIHVEANEPGEQITLKVANSRKAPLKVELYPDRISKDYDRWVNILYEYQHSYGEY